MKTVKTILFFLLLLSGQAFAQPYGEIDYANGAVMTSGIHTSVHSPGFLLAGTITTTVGTGFRLEKTGIGGDVTCGAFGPPGTINPPCFVQDYYMENIDCSSSIPGYINNFTGVSAIETNNINDFYWYATAGAYQLGCFISFLTPSGGPTTFNYSFPYLSTNLNISKPCVTQGQNKDYYICGKFDTSMYVIKIDTTGTIAWSSYYSVGHTINSFSQLTGGDLNPRAMIKSPFNSDLVIVGLVEGSPSYLRGQDGFFLSLDAATGIVNNFRSYGDYLQTSASCNHFTSIQPAYSTLFGSQGYIVGGYSDYYANQPSNTGHAWLLKLDLNGDALWNNLYTATSDNYNGEVAGVIERQTQTGFEYYAACYTNITVVDGVIVLKLDEEGNPIHIMSPGKSSEFYYYKNSIFYPINLTGSEGTGADDGLHIYAYSVGGDHHLIETYFNGVNGCETIENIQGFENGPTDISPWINSYGSLSYCSQGGYDMVPRYITPARICSEVPGSTGSNAKGITGINDQSHNESSSVYPNPSTGIFYLDVSEQADVQIFSSIGEKIKSFAVKPGKNMLDLSEFSSGIYNCKVSSPNKIYNIQLIKE